MKKIVLVITVLAISLIACEKESGNSETQPGTDLEKLLDEYGIFNTDVNFEGYSLGVDTNLIYFNGRSDENLCLKSFDRTDKTNLLSWIEDEPLEIEVHEGYGEYSTHQISEFIIQYPHNFEDKHVFILKGLARGEQYNMGQRIITSNLYFVSDDSYKIMKSLTFPFNAYFYHQISSWFENYVIVSKTPVESQLATDSCFCYSMAGDLMYKYKGDIPVSSSLPINLHECITFPISIGATFIRKNLLTQEEVWISEPQFTDLPEETRIDNYTYSLTDDGYLLYQMDYTLLSGEKGSRSIKVEIATGKIIE